MMCRSANVGSARIAEVEFNISMFWMDQMCCVWTSAPSTIQKVVFFKNNQHVLGLETDFETYVLLNLATKEKLTSDEKKKRFYSQVREQLKRFKYLQLATFMFFYINGGLDLKQLIRELSVSARALLKCLICYVNLFEHLVFVSQSQRGKIQTFLDSQISRRRSRRQTNSQIQIQPPPNAPRDKLFPQGESSLLMKVDKKSIGNIRLGCCSQNIVS